MLFLVVCLIFQILTNHISIQSSFIKPNTTIRFLESDARNKSDIYGDELEQDTVGSESIILPTLGTDGHPYALVVVPNLNNFRPTENRKRRKIEQDIYREYLSSKKVNEYQNYNYRSHNANQELNPLIERDSNETTPFSIFAKSLSDISKKEISEGNLNDGVSKNHENNPKLNEIIDALREINKRRTKVNPLSGNRIENLQEMLNDIKSFKAENSTSFSQVQLRNILKQIESTITEMGFTVNEEGNYIQNEDHFRSMLTNSSKEARNSSTNSNLSHFSSNPLEERNLKNINSSINILNTISPLDTKIYSENSSFEENQQILPQTLKKLNQKPKSTIPNVGEINPSNKFSTNLMTATVVIGKNPLTAQEYENPDITNGAHKVKSINYENKYRINDQEYIHLNEDNTSYYSDELLFPTTYQNVTYTLDSSWSNHSSENFFSHSSEVEGNSRSVGNILKDPITKYAEDELSEDRKEFEEEKSEFEGTFAKNGTRKRHTEGVKSDKTKHSYSPLSWSTILKNRRNKYRNISRKSTPRNMSTGHNYSVLESIKMPVQNDAVQSVRKSNKNKTLNVIFENLEKITNYSPVKRLPYSTETEMSDTNTASQPETRKTNSDNSLLHPYRTYVLSREVERNIPEDHSLVNIPTLFTKGRKKLDNLENMTQTSKEPTCIGEECLPQNSTADLGSELKKSTKTRPKVSNKKKTKLMKFLQQNLRKDFKLGCDGKNCQTSPENTNNENSLKQKTTNENKRIENLSRNSQESIIISSSLPKEKFITSPTYSTEFELKPSLQTISIYTTKVETVFNTKYITVTATETRILQNHLTVKERSPRTVVVTVTSPPETVHVTVTNKHTETQIVYSTSHPKTDLLHEEAKYISTTTLSSFEKSNPDHASKSNYKLGRDTKKYTREFSNEQRDPIYEISWSNEFSNEEDYWVPDFAANLFPSFQSEKSRRSPLTSDEVFDSQRTKSGFLETSVKNLRNRQRGLVGHRNIRNDNKPTSYGLRRHRKWVK